MSDSPSDTKIFVTVTPLPEIDKDYIPRRGDAILDRLNNIVPIEIGELQGQVNLFLQQINTIIESAPEQVGTFGLSEFEVSAGIALEASGKVKLMLIGEAKASGSLNAGLKFVFKRQRVEHPM
jgi:hypothetical protein